MERIKNDFTHEVKMRYADFKNGYEHNNAMLDDAEDVADDFLHKTYNSELETDYGEYGVVKIVCLWKYLYAKTIVEEILNE